MEQKTPKYITTTLPYVNAEPHVGFALEMVQADALARHYRQVGHEVFFNTGTDEHGQKIAEKADTEGVDRQAYVDHYASRFDELKGALNLSYTNFIRTTDDAHKRAATEIWKRCVDNGYIDKKIYQGLYCVGDEMFLRESDLVNGRCPNHPTQDPIHIEEENYYFKLSLFSDYLIAYLSDSSVIMPEWHRQWALEFVHSGLGDLSISRPKSRVNWGIPVPGDEEHVMYVWFDALTNYVSCLGWPDEKAEGNFSKYWVKGETLQLAGKDQVRFQSIIWQAMLKAADLPATKQIFYHGFITSGGQKMSKSLGNVISPYDMVARYGTDATRYMLLRHVHPFDDSDVTWEKMDEWYTANLVNGLGNLVSRVMKMSETHLTEIFNETHLTDRDWQGIYSEHYLAPFATFNFHEVVNLIWLNIQKFDEFITDTEPFRQIKSNPELAKANIALLREGLFLIAKRLEPILPDTAAKIHEAVVENKKPDNLFPRLES